MRNTVCSPGDGDDRSRRGRSRRGRSRRGRSRRGRSRSTAVLWTSALGRDTGVPVTGMIVREGEFCDPCIPCECVRNRPRPARRQTLAGAGAQPWTTHRNDELVLRDVIILDDLYQVRGLIPALAMALFALVRVCVTHPPGPGGELGWHRSCVPVRTVYFSIALVLCIA